MSCGFLVSYWASLGSCFIIAWAFALDGEWDIEILFACMNMKLRNISHIYTIPRVAYADLDSVAICISTNPCGRASHSDTPPNPQTPSTCLGGYRALALLQDPRSREDLESTLRDQSRAVTMRFETEYKLNLRPKAKNSSQPLTKDSVQVQINTPLPAVEPP